VKCKFSKITTIIHYKYVCKTSIFSNDFLLLNVNNWRQRLQAVVLVQNTGVHIEHLFK